MSCATDAFADNKVNALADDRRGDDNGGRPRLDATPTDSVATMPRRSMRSLPQPQRNR
jgi:hypothetical protein